MDIFTLIATIFGLIVIFAYLNHLYLKLQITIAMMAGALLVSIILIILKHFGMHELDHYAKDFVRQTHLQTLLLQGILSFLLFAGAFSIDLSTLKTQKTEVAILSSLATIASTICIAFILFYFLKLLGIAMPLAYCFLFGALISPTDPIAVIATFKHINAPKQLSTCIAGESLFNDGVGIVIFTTIAGLLFSHTNITWQHVSILFLQQSVGGIAYGFALGFLVNFLIRHSNSSKMTILITLMAVTTGYRIALALNISGALAMVVVGLLVGSQMRKVLHERAQKTVANFWELIDEVLNAVLFLLIGFELLVLHINGMQTLAAICIIPIVLLVRMVTVATPLVSLKLRLKRHYKKYTISILTWGGLRGGLAVALALSIPYNSHRDFIIALTYAVVVFSIIVQGTTIKSLGQRALEN
ncbi:MAG: sodium:proton antiporter [Gammaproteobacteria bacterium]|nr:sodium:proton antiporter [Gammaproteobacteria bacterium]MCH9743998.1 sodium:proton antiporter [Gammaproteobacteria bacterium]